VVCNILATVDNSVVTSLVRSTSVLHLSRLSDQTLTSYQEGDIKPSAWHCQDTSNIFLPLAGCCTRWREWAVLFLFLLRFQEVINHSLHRHGLYGLNKNWLGERRSVFVFYV
jgi:hypothetical protein